VQISFGVVDYEDGEIIPVFVKHDNSEDFTQE
jgi:hypothetical protein